MSIEPLPIEPVGATSDVVGPSRWSPLALGALVLSVLPIVSVVSPVLGAAALVRLRAKPTERGRALAWAAIVLGLTTSSAQLGLGLMMANAARAVTERPADALRAAWAGDAEAFRARMAGTAGEATAAGLAALVSPLRDRLGEFVSLDIDLARKLPPPAGPVPEGELSAPFVASFRGAAGPVRVPTVVIYERPAAGQGPTDVRIRRFEFDLPDGTRIVWPEDGTAERTKPEQPGQPAR